MPNPACAFFVTARAIRPKPTSPSVLPVTIVPIMCVGRHPVHCPPRRWRSPSPARRAVMSSSVIARSAVASVSTSGRIGDEHAGGFRRGDVDVVEADTVIREQLHGAAWRVDDVGRHLVGHAAQHHVGRPHRLLERVNGHRRVVRVEPRIEQRGDLLLDGRGNLSRDDNDRAFGAHTLMPWRWLRPPRAPRQRSLVARIPRRRPRRCPARRRRRHRASPSPCRRAHQAASAR